MFVPEGDLDDRYLRPTKHRCSKDAEDEHSFCNIEIITASPVPNKQSQRADFAPSAQLNGTAYNEKAKTSRCTLVNTLKFTPHYNGTHVDIVNTTCHMAVALNMQDYVIFKW